MFIHCLVSLLKVAKLVEFLNIPKWVNTMYNELLLGSSAIRVKSIYLLAGMIYATGTITHLEQPS